ncbi:MAG TPA: 2-dehydro-3-deoxygalactonokinase [Burkholderiaceae bacterium]
MTEQALPIAALIGIDWGSSGLRAFLIDGSGSTLATRSSAAGASTLKGNAAFEAALQEVAGDWIAARAELPIVACGMVGSQHGWREVPYASCPIHVSELAFRLSPLDETGLRIVPGLLHAPHDGAPDVMRGEETQIAGALQANPALADRACIVMPGTHSKWAGVRRGRIEGFATHMTGELFAVLRTHSVLGRLMATPRDGGDMHDMQAFAAGVDAARDTKAPGLTHQLFTARTLPLTGRMRGEAAADYLSGMLIGHEIEAGLAWRDAAGLAVAPLVLIGEPELCRRYSRALERFGMHADLLLPNTAPAGLWSLAHKAGLLGRTESAT